MPSGKPGHTIQRLKIEAPHEETGNRSIYLKRAMVLCRIEADRAPTKFAWMTIVAIKAPLANKIHCANRAASKPVAVASTIGASVSRDTNMIGLSCICETFFFAASCRDTLLSQTKSYITRWMALVKELAMITSA